MQKMFKPAMAGALAALLLAACGPKQPAQGAGAPPPMPVSVALPLQQQVVDWDDFIGRFEAVQSVQVRARTGGYIQQVHFKDGQYVSKGQLLFTLDPRPAQAQVASARATAAQAKSDLTRAQSLLSAQAISKEEYDSKVAAAQVANANLNTALLNLEFTRVTAPTSGVVSDRKVDAGNLIAGGSSAGDILTTIVSTDPVYFTFDASEALLLKYQRDKREGSAAPIKVRLQDETEYRWDGKLDFADNAIDGSSGVIRMRAVINNPGGFIKPGMFGHAKLEGSAAYPALLVPASAISADGARKVVMVVAKDGSVAAKPVVLGPLSGGLQVIRSGINPTDQIIVNGLQRAERPGSKVQPKLVKIDPKAAPAAGEAPVTAAPTASSATAVGQ